MEILFSNSAIVGFHIAVALTLFLIVNWLGSHSTILGYEVLTIFKEKEGDVAFNFIFRVLTPVVLIVIIAASCYATGLDGLTGNLHYSIAYYIAFRAAFNLVRGRGLLLPWAKLILQWVATLALAFLTYSQLISRKEYLFPDLNTIGNEIWLAIAAYLYVLSGHVFAGDSGAANRREKYLHARRKVFQSRFGDLLRAALPNERWQTLAMALLIVEDFNRPKIARALERACFPFGFVRTLGVMQVKTSRPISDRESVRIGCAKLVEAYRDALNDNEWRLDRQFDFLSPERRRENEESRLIHATLVRYNPSGDYARDVEATFEALMREFPIPASSSLHPDAVAT